MHAEDQPVIDLRTKELDLAYLDRTVVTGLNLTVKEGLITALVGANGSGKSTILKALARILKPKRGAVYLDGATIHSQPTKAVARLLSILPQAPEAPEGLTVRDLVAYGRFPYQSGFGVLSREDHVVINRALELTQMTEFVRRPVGQLSGGQRQRAWIAMALAQDTPVMLLDEPTTYLDMAHQLEVLQLLVRLNRDEGRTVVMVLHDLNHASRYAHHVVAVREGAIMIEGTPQEVITPSVLREVFGIEADIIVDPRSGLPLCVPLEVVPAQDVSQAKSIATDPADAAV